MSARDFSFSVVPRLLMQLISVRLTRIGLVLVAVAAIAACGGGGGDSGSTGPQPKIVATVITFPSAGVPPSFRSAGRKAAAMARASGATQAYSEAEVEITDPATGQPITTASVTVDGTSLSYVAGDQAYEGSLDIDPGATVTLNVVVNGATFTASHKNFSTYPEITTPAGNTTWSAGNPNLITWSGVPYDAAQYAVGIVDAETGALLWPTSGQLLTVSPPSASATVDSNVLTAGDRYVLVGIVEPVSLSGAASGSGLIIGGFTYTGIVVAPAPTQTQITLESIAVSPDSATVGLGASAHLTATATYSDASTQDVTTVAGWSSSDTTKVTVDNNGVISGVAAGSATVTAQYQGQAAQSTVAVFVPNPSPTPPLTQSVTYQIDYAHSGRATVGATGPTLPPTAHWSVILSGSAISYPVIAGGRVFVTTNATPPGQTYGTTLYALDEATGSVAWGPVPLSGTYSFSGIAFDHGTLFVINFDGLLRTFDAATGTPGWSKQFYGNATSPPTAVNGLVYVNTVGGGLMAVDETNGNVLWTKYGADHSSPAVSPDGVFVSDPCNAYKYDPIGGTVVWHFAEACSGGGGKTAVYANNRLYVRDLTTTTPSTQIVNVILDAATGTQLDTFGTNGPAPAFSDTSSFFLTASGLVAKDLASGNTLWTFTGDGNLVSAPVVIDQVVVVGSSSGTIWALDAASGSILWSGSTGAT